MIHTANWSNHMIWVHDNSTTHTSLLEKWQICVPGRVLYCFFFFVWCAIRTLPICRECVWFCVTHSRHCFAVCDYVCVSKCGQPEPANGVSNWGREKKWFVLAMRSDINARYSNVECSLFLLDNTVTDRWKGIKNRKHAETNGIKKKNDSRI